MVQKVKTYFYENNQINVVNLWVWFDACVSRKPYSFGFYVFLQVQWIENYLSMFFEWNIVHSDLRVSSPTWLSWAVILSLDYRICVNIGFSCCCFFFSCKKFHVRIEWFKNRMNRLENLLNVFNIVSHDKSVKL